MRSRHWKPASGSCFGEGPRPESRHQRVVARAAAMAMLIVLVGCGSSSRQTISVPPRPSPALLQSTLLSAEAAYGQGLSTAESHVNALLGSGSPSDFGNAVRPLAQTPGSSIDQAIAIINSRQWGGSDGDKQAFVTALSRLGALCSGTPSNDQFTAAVDQVAATDAKLRADVALSPLPAGPSATRPPLTVTPLVPGSTVAPPITTPAVTTPPKTLLNINGVGNSPSTTVVVSHDPWMLTYKYDCPATRASMRFVVAVTGTNGTTTKGVKGVAVTGASGTSTITEQGAGSFSVGITTACSWALRVNG